MDNTTEKKKRNCGDKNRRVTELEQENEKEVF